MLQQGQVFRLKGGTEQKSLWAYRFRLGGRGTRRVQRGGFASERDASEALERALERVRRERGCGTAMTLAELVDEYLAQHGGERETIEKLRWLLTKQVKAFGSRRLPQLRAQEIAAWRITIPPGHRFEATQALRQVLARAVVWGMIDVNPAKQGGRQPAASLHGEAAVRIVGRRRSGCGQAPVSLWPDGDVRGRDRATAGDQPPRRLHRPWRGRRPPLKRRGPARRRRDRSRLGSLRPGAVPLR